MLWFMTTNKTHIYILVNYDYIPFVASAVDAVLSRRLP